MVSFDEIGNLLLCLLNGLLESKRLRACRTVSRELIRCAVLRHALIDKKYVIHVFAGRDNHSDSQIIQHSIFQVL